MITITETETSRWFAARNFQCPKCGSSHYGTSNPHIWEMAVGDCHGQGCRFTWKRSDDEQYFVLKEEA